MNNKDLIAQYVDTGLRIPEYQFSKLPNWAKKTYFRKRLIATKEGLISNDSVILLEYELRLLDEKTLQNYLNNRVERAFHIEGYEFNLLSDDGQINLATKRAKKGNHINDEMFTILPDEIKREFIKGRLERKNPISSKILDYGGDKVKDVYLDNLVVKNFDSLVPSLQRGHGKNRDEYPNWFEGLSTDLRIKALDKILNYVIETGLDGGFKYLQIDDEYYPHLGPNKLKWLTIQYKKGYLRELMFNDLTDEQKIKYAKRRSKEDGKYISRFLRPYLKDE